MPNNMLVTILGISVTLLTAPVAWADMRDLRVEGKTPVEYVAAQTGKSWAVVIGINDYEKVRRLTYAEADARAVADTLTQRGFAVTTLYNRQATRNAILDELGDKLVDRVGENDQVLIYFAGHGETKQPKGGKAMGFLLPVEAEQEGLARTSIPMSLIRDLADGLPAKQVLFVMDVCYGGIAGQQFRSLPKYTAEYLKAITRERGRQLITAGGPKQEAMEGPEWGHSVFTYYLLEGLNKGTADLNSDGIIPASELYAYLDERVFSAAAMKGHTQRPVMWTMAAEKGEFVFLTDRGNTLVTRDSVGPGSTSTAMRQAEQELKGLQEQERLAQLQQQIAEQKKKLEVASLPSYSTPKQIERARTGQEGAAMVLVPGGQFWMGSSQDDLDRATDDCQSQLKQDEATCKRWFAPEHPRHQVTLDPFSLDTYEVTNWLFDTFVKATGYQTTAEKEGTAFAWINGKGFEATRGATWRQPEAGVLVFASDRAHHPVVSVSWHDAEAYCRWAGKRLPTEAEFEYATRAGTQTTYWWGNGTPGTRRVANIADERARTVLLGIMNGYDDGFVRTAPVGSYEANPFGLFDMTGNVSEWTADWYGGDYYAISPISPERNPTGPSSGQKRVIRGGSWILDPVRIRSADRFRYLPA